MVDVACANRCLHGLRVGFQGQWRFDCDCCWRCCLNRPLGCVGPQERRSHYGECNIHTIISEFITLAGLLLEALYCSCYRPYCCSIRYLPLFLLHPFFCPLLLWSGRCVHEPGIPRDFSWKRHAAQQQRFVILVHFNLSILMKKAQKSIIMTRSR